MVGIAPGPRPPPNGTWRGHPGHPAGEAKARPQQQTCCYHTMLLQRTHAQKSTRSSSELHVSVHGGFEAVQLAFVAETASLRFPAMTSSPPLKPCTVAVARAGQWQQPGAFGPSGGYLVPMAPMMAGPGGQGMQPPHMQHRHHQLPNHHYALHQQQQQHAQHLSQQQQQQQGERYSRGPGGGPSGAAGSSSQGASGAQHQAGAAAAAAASNAGSTPNAGSPFASGTPNAGSPSPFDPSHHAAGQALELPGVVPVAPFAKEAGSGPSLRQPGGTY